jgi:hypothetical protein
MFNAEASCTPNVRVRPAFVFDLMEPERPKVDRALLAFLKSEALHPVDFTIRDDGVVRLNPELARQVAAMASSNTCAFLSAYNGDTSAGAI